MKHWKYIMGTILSTVCIGAALMSNTVNADSNVAINQTNFPDENFRECVKEFDVNSDGYLSQAELDDVLRIDVRHKKIKDLSGIEFFTNVEDLTCWYNELTELDVSKNINLKELYCDENQLSELDVSHNTSLTLIWCKNNNISELDVSNNVLIEYIQCDGNNLTELDLSNNPVMRTLYCSYNNIKSLKYCDKMQVIYCRGNELTSLDLSELTDLSFLNCESNKLTSLDLSNNKNLIALECSNNRLSSLVVSNHSKLREIACFENDIKELDVSGTELAGATLTVEDFGGYIAAHDVSDYDTYSYLNYIKFSYKYDYLVVDSNVLVKGSQTKFPSPSTVLKISKADISGISDTSYSGKEIELLPKITYEGKLLVNGIDYELSYYDNIRPGTASVIITGIGDYAGVERKEFTITPCNIDDVLYSGITDKTYTGSALTQNVELSLGDYELVMGEDYTLSYSNNINAGTATITFTGLGNFTGTVKRTFTINGKNISSAAVTGIADKTYTGNKKYQEVVVELGGKKLKENTDYSITYSDNVNAGKATVTITGKGNYTGTINKTFAIALKDISGLTVSGISDKTYTGKSIEQSVKVTNNDNTLVVGKDYSVSYSNNTNVGKATLTITGTGNYKGTITKTYKITAKDITGAVISDVKDKNYTGSALAQKPTVKLDNVTLVAGTDYEVSYSNNTKIGTATVIITGKGNYSGTASISFKILANDISVATINGIKNKEFTGKAITQDLTITLGSKTLVYNQDYSVAYKNNINAGTATITITGKGIYSGTNEVTFDVLPKSIKGAVVNDLMFETYTGKPITQKIEVTLGDVLLTESKDYKLSYSNNINAGEATVSISGIGNYSGVIEKYFGIDQADMSSAKIVGSMTKSYTGKEVKLDITLKLGDKELIEDRDFTISYTNNKKLGTAKVKIEGTGNYFGFIDSSFDIIATLSPETFPDDNLRKYLKKYDVDNDGIFDNDELDSVKEVICNDMGITTLNGIELFKNLQLLHCYNNKLTSLYVGGNTQLVSLYCDNNQIKSLDLSKNTELKYLTCANNNIKSLNLENTPFAEANLNYKNITIDREGGAASYIHGYDEARYIPIHYANSDIKPQYRRYLLLVDGDVELNIDLDVSESGVAGFVERLYTICLGRASEVDGKAYWIGELKKGETGAKVADGFFFSPELVNKKLSNKEFITRLYRTFMGREPDDDGMQYWLQQMSDGYDRRYVFEGFINSPEWADICLEFGIRSGGLVSATYEKIPSVEVEKFAERLYTTCLGRAPEKAGLDYWATELANLRQTGTVAAGGFFFSEEFTKLNLSNRDYVTRLYRTFMGREPDEDGYNYWLKEMDNGMSRQDVFNGFSFAPEFAELCANAGIMR